MRRNVGVKLNKFKSKTYIAWQNMRQRCNDSGRQDYHNYGGRGITVCPEWDSFSCFLADMGPAPANKSLDRIENNKGYYKDNCKWSTHQEQMLNRRERSEETALRPTNTTGISGVYWVSQKSTWQVKAKNVATKTFYSLFEAVCYRRSQTTHSFIHS